MKGLSRKGAEAGDLEVLALAPEIAVPGRRIFAWARGVIFASIAFGLAACTDNSHEDHADGHREKNLADNEKVVKVEEFVSKTPQARIYMQPPKDKSIVWQGIENKIALVDTRTGDVLISQVADRERRLIYFAFLTKNRELVRIFRTQWGGGFYGRHWKAFPVRVYDIEEAKKITPAIEAARKRATLKHLTQLLSSWPDFEQGKFIVVDAPISEVDPL